MIGVRTDSSDKKVCTGLVATRRFRCGIVVTRNERSKRAKPVINVASIGTSPPALLSI